MIFLRWVPGLVVLRTHCAPAVLGSHTFPYTSHWFTKFSRHPFYLTHGSRFTLWNHTVYTTTSHYVTAPLHGSTTARTLWMVPDFAPDHTRLDVPIDSPHHCVHLFLAHYTRHWTAVLPHPLGYRHHCALTADLHLPPPSLPRTGLPLHSYLHYTYCLDLEVVHSPQYTGPRTASTVFCTSGLPPLRVHGGLIACSYGCTAPPPHLPLTALPWIRLRILTPRMRTFYTCVDLVYYTLRGLPAAPLWFSPPHPLCAAPLRFLRALTRRTRLTTPHRIRVCTHWFCTRTSTHSSALFAAGFILSRTSLILWVHRRTGTYLRAGSPARLLRAAAHMHYLTPHSHAAPHGCTLRATPLLGCCATPGFDFICTPRDLHCLPHWTALHHAPPLGSRTALLRYCALLRGDSATCTVHTSPGLGSATPHTRSYTLSTGPMQGSHWVYYDSAVAQFCTTTAPSFACSSWTHAIVPFLSFSFPHRIFFFFADGFTIPALHIPAHLEPHRCTSLGSPAGPHADGPVPAHHSLHCQDHGIYTPHGF